MDLPLDRVFDWQFSACQFTLSDQLLLAMLYVLFCHHACQFLLCLISSLDMLKYYACVREVSFLSLFIFLHP